VGRFFLSEVVLSVAGGVEVDGIKVSDGRAYIIKILMPAALRKQATALLPQLAFPTKSGGSFLKSEKTVCFWQRLKRTETEKTFAGQRAY
jgi:hypothetical protein